MTISWDSYEIYDPGVFGPLRTLPRREARFAYDHSMAEMSTRVEMLRELLRANGAELSDTDDGLRRLNAWFFANVEPDPEQPGRLLPEWYSVVHDVGVFLGEALIARCPGLRWEFYVWGKKNAAYQRPVIMGFSKVPYPKFNMDFDRNAAAYAHHIVASRGSIRTHGKVTVRGVEIDVDAVLASSRERPIETDAFVRWVKYAESKA
jgi:hypothetical protein